MSQFNEFHLGENLDFQAGGLLTSFKLSEEEVLLRKEKVVRILERHSGLYVNENEQGISIDLSSLPAHRTNRIIKLLEENSILLDSLHYLSMDISKNWTKISDITNTILFLKFQLNQSNMVDLYNFVDINIGEIILDLSRAFNNGKYSPTEEEKTQLNDLIEERKRFLDFLNTPGGVVIFGN